MDRKSIKRESIKIRKPIFKEYCDCWGIKVMLSEGEAQFIIGDGMSLDGIINFLDSVSGCMPIYFSEPLEECEDKIRYILSKNIPVFYRTDKVVPDWLIMALKSVPHSGLFINIDYLDGEMKTSLGRGASPIADLRHMLFYAKAHKVFSNLVIDYKPHLVTHLDLLDIIDEVKNFTPHVILNFESIPAEVYEAYRYSWEAIKPSAVESFHQHYTLVPETLTWVVNTKTVHRTLGNVQTFLKGKKISLEVPQYYVCGNRVRHAPSGFSSLPFGIKPFFYKREVEGFVAEGELQECFCPNCQKPIFS